MNTELPYVLPLEQTDIAVANMIITQLWEQNSRYRQALIHYASPCSYDWEGRCLTPQSSTQLHLYAPACDKGHIAAAALYYGEDTTNPSR